MENMLDYLDWRGDVPVGLDGFGEVDNLLLAKLVHVDLSHIVPSPDEAKDIALRDAAAAYYERYGEDGEEIGLLVPAEIPGLLRRLARSRRFCDMRLSAFREILDEEKQEQFAAMTVEIGDGTLYCAFRGTDDTLVGWKEDMNLGVLESVPSQREALEYLTRAARRNERLQLRVGGHSKGGNLAVYSAVYAPEDVQERIVRIYNNDGPGFRRELLDSPDYHRVERRILTIMPQNSVVGQMLARPQEVTVVHSTGTGIGQHNGFTWEVRGREFVHMPDFSHTGKRTEETLDSVLDELSGERLNAFVEALYEVLTSTGAHTLSDLNEEKLKSASGMLKTYRGLDDEMRRALSGAIRLLVKTGAKSFSGEMREMTDRGVDGLRRRAGDMWRRFFEQEN